MLFSKFYKLNFWYQIRVFFIALFICVSCVSCSHKSSDLDLTKLREKESDLGVFVFRPMSFTSVEDAKSFITNKHSSTLTNNNISCETEVSDADNYKFSITKDSNEVLKLLKNHPSVSKFMLAPYKEGETIILKPEYFYHVGMLPAGKYFISTIGPTQCTTLGHCAYKNFSKHDAKYFFTIKANQINYIGDFYLIDTPEGVSGLLFKEYKMRFILYDGYRDSKNFIKKFFPEINLPVTNSFISTKANV